MILVDTSVWIEHLRSGHPTLAALLERGAVLGHPWVIGELALGRLGRREEILRLLRGLPGAEVATTDELAAYFDRHELFGLGIGYVDAQLLASSALTPDARLWTLDRRLAGVATRLGVGAGP